MSVVPRMRSPGIEDGLERQTPMRRESQQSRGEMTQAQIRTVIMVMERNRQMGEIIRIYLVPS